MVKLISVEIEGFCSIGKTLLYPLDKPGITVLSGENGVGKTTVFSALTWGLYGKKLKEKSSVNTWEDKQPTDYRGTRVIVNLVKDGVTYNIYRHQGYGGKTLGSKGGSRLLVVRDGKELSNVRDKRDVQDYIVKLMGCSYDLFKNSIVFGQRMKRLMEETGPSKKKILEEAFEITYIEEAKKLVDAERRDINKRINELEPKYQKYKERLSNQKSKYRDTLRMFKSFEADKKTQLSALHKKHKTLTDRLKDCLKNLEAIGDTDGDSLKRGLNKKKKEIKDVEKRLSELKKIEDKNFVLSLEINQLEKELKGLRSDIKDINSNLAFKGNTCPSCGSIMNLKTLGLFKKNLRVSRKSKLQKVKALKGRLRKSLEIHKSNEDIILKEINQKTLLKVLNKELEDLTKLSYLHHNLDNIKSTTLKDLAIVEKELEVSAKSSCKLEPDKIKLSVNITRKKFKPIKKELKYCKRELELTNWALKEPLSNSGVKAYIFTEMVDLINDKLVTYANHLGWVIKFFIDKDSANQNLDIRVFQGNYERSYEDLSGGQSQLVDICLAFAVHDILSLEKPCNILLMDEVFESLRGKNIDIVTELIRLKSRDRSIHLVTHLTDFSHTNAHILEFKLDREGFTTFS